MPQAIAAALPYIKVALAAYSIYSTVAAANTAQQRENRARQIAGQRDVTVRSTVAPQSIIYGQARVSGPVVYANTVHAAGSTNNTDLWMVIAIAGHECDDFLDVWVDENQTEDADINWTTGAVTGGPFYAGTNHASFYKKLGTASQTVLSDLSTAFATDITSNFRGRGIAYLATKFTLSKTSRDMFPNQPNNIRVLVKGKKVYDPRRDPTHASYSGVGSQTLGTASTYEWSDNPILCAADYLTDTNLGMGVPTSQIDWDLAATHADICDELVDIPGPSTEKRFTCNGQMFTTSSHRDNLDALLSSCNGRYSWRGGKFRIRSGAYETPSVAFTASDIVGDIQVRTAMPREERYNTVRAAVIDPDQDYNEIEVGAMTDAAYVTRDGGQTLFRDLVLPFTNEPRMAQRLAFKQLLQSDQPTTVVVPLNWRGLKAAPGDFVTLTVDDLGWSSKVFRVTGMEASPEGFKLSMREDEEAAYADPEIADYLASTTLPSMTTPDAHSDGVRTIAGPPGSFTWISADGGSTWEPSDDTQSITLYWYREGVQVASVQIDADLDTATGDINVTDGTHTGEDVTVTIYSDNTYSVTAQGVHDDSNAYTYATFQALSDISGAGGGGGGGK